VGAIAPIFVAVAAGPERGALLAVSLPFGRQVSALPNTALIHCHELCVGVVCAMNKAM
jgi:hypothetical protein